MLGLVVLVMDAALDVTNGADAPPWESPPPAEVRRRGISRDDTSSPTFATGVNSDGPGGGGHDDVKTLQRRDGPEVATMISAEWRPSARGSGCRWRTGLPCGVVETARCASALLRFAGSMVVVARLAAAMRWAVTLMPAVDVEVALGAPCPPAAPKGGGLFLPFDETPWLLAAAADDIATRRDAG